jgi:hypothetical protein
MINCASILNVGIFGQGLSKGRTLREPWMAASKLEDCLPLA